MIGLNSIYKHYKLVYLDTNIVSNICKKTNLLIKFLDKFPIIENYLLCFSTYTLREIAKNETLYKDFKKFFSIYPCVIVTSYHPLVQKETDYIADDKLFVNPIIISPQGLVIDCKTLNPNSLDVLLDTPEIKNAFANIDRYTSDFYNEVITILDKQEFVHLNKNNIKNQKGDFVRAFMRYELKYRFFNGQDVKVDKKKIKQLKSLDILAHAVFYKFFSDINRKIEYSDIIDILIMTTSPYVHTFIAEGNAIAIMKMIRNQTTAIDHLNLVSLSELQ